MDDIVFRYTPSLRTSIRARETADRLSGQSLRLLVVDEPELPNNRAEVAAATAFFEDHRALRGRDRRRGAVLDAIVQADVCHFACHGENSWDNPCRAP